MQGIDGEILVVDNHSSDGSMELLPRIFPGVKFIASDQNLGFAKANNLALRQAAGSVILFLNPDTVIPEDVLSRTLALLEANGQTGALGIRMIDGSGRFLPESKRGFPSPQASLFKLTGLAGLFPRSAFFGHYYLGWLAERKNHEVEVLSGAFMMVKKRVLDEAGSFDEQFFMYGEDIDLSYRISQAGYRNFYLGEAAILHFKGESTRKDRRHTRMFYDAMDIFIKKHYRGGQLLPFRLMQAGIEIASLLSKTRNHFRGEKAKPAQAGNIVLLAGTKAAASEAAALLEKLVQVSTVLRLADVAELQGLLEKREAEVVVFDAGSLAYGQIISVMADYPGKAIYKIMNTDGLTVVGSDIKGVQGEIWRLDEDGGKRGAGRG